MTDLNQVIEVLVLLVYSWVTDETILSPKLPVAERAERTQKDSSVGYVFAFP